MKKNSKSENGLKRSEFEQLNLFKEINLVNDIGEMKKMIDESKKKNKCV